MLDTFKRYGGKEIDTARGYGDSENVIGDQNIEGQGFIIDTKIALADPLTDRNVKKSQRYRSIEQRQYPKAQGPVRQGQSGK